MLRKFYFTRDFWVKLGALSGSLLAYSALFFGLYPLLGPGVTVFVLIPMGVAAWYYRYPGAILAVLLQGVALNGLLIHWQHPGELGLMLREGGYAVILLNSCVALFVAWVSTRRKDAIARLAVWIAAEEKARQAQVLYQTIFDNAGAGILILEADKSVALVNSEFERISGYSEEELAHGRLWDQFIHPEDRVQMAAYHFARRRDPDSAPHSYDFRAIRKDGQVRTLWTTVALIPGTQRSVVSVIDITERQRAERIRRSVYEISAAAHTTESLSLLFTYIHNILANLIPAENFYIALYDDAEDVLSFPYFIDRYDPPPGARRLGRGLTEYVLRRGEPVLVDWPLFESLRASGEVDLIGSPFSEWLGAPLVVAGEAIGVMALQNYQSSLRLGDPEMEIVQFVSDQIAMVIQRKRAEQRLRYLSVHDPLTGLYNRLYFDEMLVKLTEARIFPVGVLVADVDDLKLINDSLGHAAGDEHLRAVAEMMTCAFRRIDVTARIGGDEFAVLLPDANGGQTEAAAKRLRRRLHAYSRKRPDFPRLRVSLGWAVAEAGLPLSEALRLADQHMYLDKGAKEPS